jgi:hypothetical protein
MNGLRSIWIGSEVERILHRRPSTLVENDGMVEARYEYADGPPAWSVLKSLVYVAGDVFRFFLSELIFCPIELYAEDEIKRVAVAEYSEDDKLAAWNVRRASSGKTLVAQKSPKCDRYAAEAKSPSPLSENMYAMLPAVSESPPAVWTGQDVIFAPESVSTERDNVEFEVLIKNTDRYTRLLVDGRPARRVSGAFRDHSALRCRDDPRDGVHGTPPASPRLSPPARRESTDSAISSSRTVPTRSSVITGSHVGKGSRLPSRLCD